MIQPQDRGYTTQHRRNLTALASRLLPAVVLAIGGIVWMSFQASTLAQSPRPLNSQQGGFNYNNSPYGSPTNSFRSSSGAVNQNAYPAAGQPAARIAAGPASSGDSFSIPAAPAEAPPDETAEASQPWAMPGFVQKIAEGGLLMIPLGVCSLIVLGLSLERMIALRRSRVIPKPFVRRFTECVEDGQLSYEEATSICDEFDCPVAEVFHAAVRRWGRPMLEIEQAVIDAGDRVGDSLRRFLRVFHAISNVTPLIGLLGTVLGMIQAFETLSAGDAASGGQSDLLAAGISTALMTTAGGLSVAIPAYLAYMYFAAKSDRYLAEIDRLCQRVIDCISAEGLEDAGATKSPRKRRAA